MKIAADPKLFWFLKQGAWLDLDAPPTREMVFEQVLSHGRAPDITALLKALGLIQFKESFQKASPFLPPEVRSFWEYFLGTH